MLWGDWEFTKASFRFFSMTVQYFCLRLVKSGFCGYMCFYCKRVWSLGLIQDKGGILLIFSLAS